MYEVSSYYDKIKKKTIKKSGKYLGRITQEGIVNSDNRSNFVVPRSVSVKEFGASDYILSCLEEEKKVLSKYFASDWQAILLISLFRLLYQSCFKQMSWYYESSYLSETYPSVDLSGKQMTALLQRVGNHREHIALAMRDLCAGEEILLIDSTHITTQSQQNLSAQVGYNSQKQFDTQVNLLYLFSQDTQMPIFYRCVQGSVREVRSFRLTLQESGIKSAVLVADKGFYSQNNVTILEEDGWQYVLPLRRSSALLDYSSLQSTDKKGFDGFFMFEARVIWYKKITLESNELSTKQVLLFLDEALKLTETKDYLQRIAENKQGYTLEAFYQKQICFGTLGIITNANENKKIEIIDIEPEILQVEMEEKKEKQSNKQPKKEPKFEMQKVMLPPQKVYEYFKSRNDIEQLNDTYKNVLEADKTYMQSEASMEAWHFINFFALRAYYRIFAQLKETGLNKKYAPADILLLLQNCKKIKINGQWVEAEVPKKAKIILDEFNAKKQPVT
ncbi:MAG: hypothetical protein EAY69_01840 [Cytophagales bacterium]|nr:MAG: hypothetical protein EAY69_01840 [Cytophagales bacterium]